MIKKPLHKSIRAIKTLLFLPMVVFLFLGTTAFAITYDFENGNTNGWVGSGGSTIVATTSKSYMGNWSGYLQNGTGLVYYDYGATTSAGNYFLAYFGNYFWGTGFVLTDDLGLSGCNFNATGTWHIAGIEWNGSNFKCYSDGVWSGWNDLGLTYSRVNIAPVLSLFWVDDLDTSITGCTFYESYYSCQNNGCCWYYSQWLQENYCVSCPTGECGSDFLSCQNCNSTSTCEAQENCYWFNGVCKFGQGSCGEGLDLQFCANEGTCTGAGGYWYDSFCWLSPKTAPLETWEDYYAEHGDYATPTAFINEIAGNSENFLGKIGGFITTFQNYFDLNEARYKGEQLGAVIPIARGFLAVLNSFTGNLPVATLFLVILTFALAVIVFRLSRGLFQLVKFW